MKYIDLEIGSDEWKEYRRTKIGASETAQIMGISPFGTAYELYQEKVEGKERGDSHSMKRGRDREIEALNWLNETTENNFQPKMVQSEIDWKFATLDGLSGNEKEAVEIKWARKEIHEMAKKGVVVDYYQTQLQSQMFCTGLSNIWFLSCYQEKDSEIEFCLFQVKRDDEMIAKIIEAERNFYENHLSKKIPPPLTDRDYIEVQDSDSILFDIMCYRDRDYNIKIKQLEDERDSNKAKLIELSKGRNLKSNDFKLSKSIIKGRIDYDKILDLHLMDLEQYRKPSTESWRISKA